MDISILINNFVDYVFGNIAYASMAFLLIIVIIGVKARWSLDSYVIVLTPAISFMSTQFLPYNIEPLWLMGIGMVIGFGLLALLRR